MKELMKVFPGDSAERVGNNKIAKRICEEECTGSCPGGVVQ